MARPEVYRNEIFRHGLFPTQKWQHTATDGKVRAQRMAQVSQGTQRGTTVFR